MQLPPDGIWLDFPQFGIHKQFWSFRSAGDYLEEVARGNPRLKIPTSRDTIDDLIDSQNAQRVSQIPGAEMYLAEGGQTVSGAKKAIPERLASVAVRVRILNAGRSLLAEWKEQGYSTVTSDESNRRGSVCATCPKNGDGGLEKYFTVPLSEKIRRDIGEIQGSGLVTDWDDKLNVCEACLCPLKLKIHCELPLILKHLKPEARQQLDARCWITK